MKDIVVLVSPVQAHESSGWLERDLVVGPPFFVASGRFYRGYTVKTCTLEDEECILKKYRHFTGDGLSFRPVGLF